MKIREWIAEKVLRVDVASEEDYDALIGKVARTIDALILVWWHKHSVKSPSIKGMYVTESRLKELRSKVGRLDKTKQKKG